MVFDRPFAIETNTFSLLLRGDEKIAKAISNAEMIAVPIVVVAELRAGFQYGGKVSKYGPILDDFLADTSTTTLHIDDDTTTIYAEIYAYARSIGRQFSNNDLWIAALCIQYSYPLLTFDKDFDALPQLRRVDV